MNHKFHITLVRHGETMENRENVIQGQADTQLSDLGRQQASLVASRLQHECFTHMYSSDLSRAADTAKAIASANEPSACHLWLDKRLRERSFGVMEGKRFSEFQTLLKDLGLSPQTYTPENGESVEQVSKRAMQFFHDVCKLVTASSDELDSYGSEASEGLEEVDENSSRRSPNASSSATSAASSDDNGLSNKGKASETVSVDIDGSSGSKASNGTVSKLESENSSQETVEKHILIVSHGLLLRELKRLILDRYKGSLLGEKAAQLNRISPNTGVSKFTLNACMVGKKIKVSCLDCHFINCSDHLRRSNQNLVSEAKYQGAV